MPRALLRDGWLMVQLWTYVHNAFVYAEDIDRMNIYDGTEVYETLDGMPIW
jgi:hypothetical protein